MRYNKNNNLILIVVVQLFVVRAKITHEFSLQREISQFTIDIKTSK